MSCCRAKVSGFGADYTGPLSPDYDYSTSADNLGMTYTDPAVNPIDYPNAPWGAKSANTSAGVVQMDPIDIVASAPPAAKVSVGLIAGALAVGALVLFGSDDKKKRRRRSRR